MRHRVRHSNAGFTLIELIIILAIMATAALILLPRLFWYADRAKLRGAALATKTMMQQARLAALKGNGQGRVVFDFTKGQIYAFVDTDNNGTFQAATDRQLGIYNLKEVGKKTVVQFMHQGDAAPNASGAVTGFGTCGTARCAAFDETGAAQTGSVFFTDGYSNFLEVRVATAATGKVELRKFSRTKNDYILDAIHTEAGSRSTGWDWYEERDARVPLN